MLKEAAHDCKSTMAFCVKAQDAWVEAHVECVSQRAQQYVAGHQVDDGAAYDHKVAAILPEGKQCLCRRGARKRAQRSKAGHSSC